MRRRARTDPSGGRSVMSVPTGTIDTKQKLVKVIRLLALDEEDILYKLRIREGPTRGHARAAECVVRSKTVVAVAFLRSRYWRLRLDN